LQSLLLRRFGQMDPELEQHEAFVGEHLLVLADRLHARVHLIRVDFALHMSEHRFVVPGVHQDADLALRRQRAPIAPCGRSRSRLSSGATLAASQPRTMPIPCATPGAPSSAGAISSSSLPAISKSLRRPSTDCSLDSAAMYASARLAENSGAKNSAA